MSEDKTKRSSSSAVVEQKHRLTKPSMYKVKLLNDDFTPIDFVVYTVQKFFHKTHDDALGLALQIHKTGGAVCGFYTKDVAETKVGIVNDYARKAQHPLKCTFEENA